jgi:hypothetical protein
MKRAKKLLAAVLVSLMMISSMVVNVSAAEEPTFSDSQVSINAYCTQHNIASKLVTTYISSITTHKYQSSTNAAPIDCYVTTYVNVYHQYCTKCGQTFGNYNSTWDSHSAH